MLEPIVRLCERFLGRGSGAITVPAMDGALKPNQALESATRVLSIPAPDNLVAHPGGFAFSSAQTLFHVLGSNAGSSTPMAAFDEDILSVAAHESGVMAVGLDHGGLRIVGGPRDAKHIPAAGGVTLNCVVAMTFLSETSLLICNGSSVNPASAWQRDLLDATCAGTVLIVDLQGGNHRVLAKGLSFPYGVVRSGKDSIVVAESWKSRLVELPLSGSGARRIVLDSIPGHPSRIISRPGGYWLTVFAPRSQLMEFVRRERRYREAMMAEIPPHLWLAPTLSSGRSFYEPMQGAALKQMGILKPWAPSRSYGLVVALDETFLPVASQHSRAGRERHGITSVLELEGRVLVTSKGGDEILALHMDGADVR